MAETKPDPKLFPELYRDPKTRKRLTPTCSAASLEEHHFFQLLSWNPSAIKATALLWKQNQKMTLVDLYKILVEVKLRKSHELNTVCGKMNKALQV